MNRINQLFQHKKSGIRSVYFTAGFPNLNDTIDILCTLEKAGIDLVEIGMPFSDPLADGPVIQQSSTVALKNGMTITLLFEQLKNIRQKVNIPLVLMGYMNPVLQYGVENFCKMAAACGIDGLILPDMPAEVYEQHYQELFQKHNLHHILLITPRTSDDRIRYIDQLSGRFLYAVSSSATTGNVQQNKEGQEVYFKRLSQLNLKNPVLIGFGISNKEQLEHACQYAAGAVIGTAFIKQLSNSDKELPLRVRDFVKSLD